MVHRIIIEYLLGLSLVICLSEFLLLGASQLPQWLAHIIWVLLHC